MSLTENKTLTPDRIGIILGEGLRKPDEPDRVFPKNKKVEIVFLVETVNAILPRTEGVEDITLLKLPGTEYEVPMILPEKLQAVARRRMLAQLRRYRDRMPDRLKNYLETLASLYRYEKKSRGKKEAITVGFTKADIYKENPREWNCYIQPPGGDKREATDVGMDGFCPACALFGTVIDSTRINGIGNESIGVKSRVEFDPAFAFADKEKSVAPLTHNKVSDGVSWTGQSLYTEYHVMPGVLFVGKVTLEDVTEAELKAFLAILATIDRLGGRERVFGGVRIHLVGIRVGSYETVSALEITRILSREYSEADYLPDAETVEEKVWKIIENRGFYRMRTNDYAGLLDNMRVWDDLWRDTVYYDKRIVERVLSLVRNDFKEVVEG